MPVFMQCLCCSHRWLITAIAVEGDEGETVLLISGYDDLCRHCGAQGEIFFPLPIPESKQEESFILTPHVLN